MEILEKMEREVELSGMNREHGELLAWLLAAAADDRFVESPHLGTQLLL